MPAVPPGAGKGDAEAAATMERLRDTVDAIVSAGGNLARFDAVRDRAEALGLGPLARVEPIDWWTLQKNLLIEIPGATDRIIYITAHYDKTDANPLKLLSLVLNGLPDEAVGWSYRSEGAIDNATGVAVALELARALAAGKPRHTYRVLITGAEESGLRGSRAYVSRLSREERSRIAYDVNVDTVGLAGKRNCVSANVSDPALVAGARASAAALKMPLGTERIPFMASGDFAPFRHSSFARDLRFGLLFNLAGGLLPQRSWFSRGGETRVINFSACGLLGPWDYVASSTLLPVGLLHGPRDRASKVDPARLYEQYAIIRKMLGSEPLP